MYRPGTNRQVPTIIGVRRVPEAPAASLARRRKKGQTKGRSKSRRLESEDVQSRQVSVVRDESGWEEETVPVGTVLNYETGDEVEKRTSLLTYRIRLLMIGLQWLSSPRKWSLLSSPRRVISSISGYLRMRNSLRPANS